MTAIKMKNLLGQIIGRMLSTTFISLGDEQFAEGEYLVNQQMLHSTSLAGSNPWSLAPSPSNPVVRKQQSPEHRDFSPDT